MQALDVLKRMRQTSGDIITQGLSDDIINQFLESDPQLSEAIRLANIEFQSIQKSFPELIDLDEVEQIGRIQQDFINFYADDAINPYVSIAAKGPWIITLKGAVIHDSGGYGMLGFGHSPDLVLNAMNRPHVMANIMTSNISQLRFTQALKKEVGHTRNNHCPYSKFLCLNSGSEAVTVAARISDINAKSLTDPGKRHHGKTIKLLAFKGGFHGRTDRPAQFSDSTRAAYEKHLRSFRDRKNLITVEPNNCEQLQSIFAQAEVDNVYIEAFFMEPVMGEGDPGMAVTEKFYSLARQLTLDHECLFLVDSIQAGLRAHGCLSILDYPGFEKAQAPDMETYSKALNAGQYPLSVLALTKDTSQLYKKGVYGNTMTTNPRAMDVACEVMNVITPELRENIRIKGIECLEKLGALKDELNGKITKVQGTGLLFSCELDSSYKAYGTDSSEEYLRHHGIGVIHGGENSLRFTPHFAISSDEIDMLVSAVRDAMLNGPRIQLDNKPEAINQ